MQAAPVEERQRRGGGRGGIGIGLEPAAKEEEHRGLEPAGGCGVVVGELFRVHVVADDSFPTRGRPAFSFPRESQPARSSTRARMANELLLSRVAYRQASPLHITHCVSADLLMPPDDGIVETSKIMLWWHVLIFGSICPLPTPPHRGGGAPPRTELESELPPPPRQCWPLSLSSEYRWPYGPRPDGLAHGTALWHDMARPDSWAVPAALPWKGRPARHDTKVREEK